MTDCGNRFVIVGKMLNDFLRILIDSQGIRIDCTAGNHQKIIIIQIDVFKTGIRRILGGSFGITFDRRDIFIFSAA